MKFDPTAGLGEDEVEFLLDYGESGSGNGQFGAWQIRQLHRHRPRRQGLRRRHGAGAGLRLRRQLSRKHSAAGGDGAVADGRPGGNVYFTLCNPSTECIVEFKNQTKPYVVKLNASGGEVCKAMVPDPRALATDPAGSLYVVSGIEEINSQMKVVKFTPTCAEVPEFAFSTDLKAQSGSP